MATSELTLLLKVKDEATQALQKFSGVMGGNFNDAVKASNMVAVGLAAAGAAAGAFGVLAVNAARDATKIQNQLNAVLESTGGIAGITAGQVNKLAGELSQLTNYEDDTIIGGQNILLTFTKIGKDVFPQATQTMLDMSAALGQDLKSSAIQLGKALNDPIEGATALRRVGVSLSDQQMEQIKVLVEHNKLLDAQKLILNELATEFGGSAQAQADAFTILKNNIGELVENIGLQLLPTLNIFFEKANQFIQDILPRWIEKIKEVINWFREHQIVLAMVVGGILGALIPAFMALAITIITSTIPAFIALAISLAPFIIGGAILGGLIAGIYYIITHWELIKQKAIEIWDAIKAYFKEVWDGIKIVFGEAAQSLTDKWTAFKNFWVGLWDAIKNTIQSASDWIMSKVNAIMDSVSRAIAAASNLPGVGMVRSAVGVVGSAVGSIGRAIGVKDAIISPRGDIITTDPMDYLIATKNPMGLSGGGIVINITGNSFMGDRDVARKLGNELVSYLKMNMRI